MHCQEQHVRALQHVELGQPLRQHAPLAVDQRRRVGDLFAHVAAEPASLVALRQHARGGIHDVDGVAPAAQRGHDLRRGGERHHPLGCRATRQDRDAHQRSPAS